MFKVLWPPDPLLLRPSMMLRGVVPLLRRELMEPVLPVERLRVGLRQVRRRPEHLREQVSVQ